MWLTDHPSLRIGTIALGGMLVLTAAWIGRDDVALSRLDVIDLGRAVLIAGACIGLLKAVSWRLQEDTTATAQWFCKTASVVQLVIASLLVLMTASCLTVASSYAVASLNLPLQDSRLAAIDTALGFDWLQVLRAINDMPMLSRALTLLYHSTVSQIVLVVLILAATERRHDLAQFCAIFCLTSFAVVVVSGLLPAEGAYRFHQPDPGLFANLSATPGTWHLQDFHALRNGSFDLFTFRRIEGIITFPSFHTVLAILTVYAVRGIKPVFVVAAIANGLVILSTLPEGGHYFIDLVIGAAIVTAAIAFVRRLENPAANPAGALAARSPLAPA